MASSAVFAVPSAVASAGSSGSWSNVPDNSSGDQFVSGLTCYSKINCVAISGIDDDVFLSNDGGASWNVDHSSKEFVQEEDIYCEASGTCFMLSVLVTPIPIKYDGVAIAESTDGGSSWTEDYASHVAPEKGQQPTYELDAIACLSSSHCVVSGNDGTTSFMLTTTNGGKTWSKLAQSVSDFESLSCPSATVCYGVTGVDNANVYKSTNGGKTWAEMAVPANYLHYPGSATVKRYNLDSITCRTVTYCVAGGEAATVSSSASVQPIYPLIWGMVNGASWLYAGPIDTTSHSTPKYQAYIDPGSITCPKTDYCFAGTSYGMVVDVTYLNHKLEVSGDADTANAPYVQMTNLDCISLSQCVAAGQNAKSYVSQFGLLPISPVIL